MEGKETKKHVAAYNERHKYLITIIIGMAVLCFAGENSLIQTIKYEVRLSELRNQVKECEDKYRRDSIAIQQLKDGHIGAENIARERYLMKRPNEDIFVISDENAN